MSRIRVLPDRLVNQIAAGEVIERPASVVKELLENALDAGARSLAIDLAGGGRRRIRVADDGCGMDRDDAVLAFERHATSKIGPDADLVRIDTLGFRGEALPAIASVSRVTLTSSPDGRSGTRVEVEGGRILRVAETGHPRGTTVEVSDLFFNTPARSKFLRSAPTELSHVTETLAAYAAAAPAVGMQVTHEGRRLLDAPPCGGEDERIRQVFGEDWAGALPVARSRGGLAVRGLLAPPDRSASSRRLQHLYVNGRLVRDRLIAHALTAACEGYLPKDRHAAAFLFVTCPEDLLDVNVHPAKAEVRFRSPGEVHDLVHDAVSGALRSSVPVTHLRARAAAAQGGPGPLDAGRCGLDPSAAHVHETVRGYLGRHGEATPDGASPPWRRRPEPGGSARGTADGANAGGSDLATRAEGEAPAALAHYLQSYIVAADAEGLLLVDQHAAHERILFERLRARDGRDGAAPGQALLFPLTVPVPRGLAERVEEVVAELAQLGLAAEPFGPGSLVLREAPSDLEGCDLRELLRDLMDGILEEEPRTGPPPRRDRLLATVACHAAVKVRMPLTAEKMNYLISELFRTTAPLKCPHGRPAVLRFSLASIERGFDRR